MSDREPIKLYPAIRRIVVATAENAELLIRAGDQIELDYGGWKITIYQPASGIEVREGGDIIFVSESPQEIVGFIKGVLWYMDNLLANDV